MVNSVCVFLVLKCTRVYAHVHGLFVATHLARNYSIPSTVLPPVRQTGIECIDLKRSTVSHNISTMVGDIAKRRTSILQFIEGLDLRLIITRTVGSHR